MKRIYSIMFAAVAIFTAASCQKELADNTLPTGGEKYSFTATISPDTKTVLVDGNKVNWSVGDNISVFDADNKPVTFEGQNTEVSATAEFHADAYNPAATIYAVYPANANAKLEGTQITGLRIAGTQKAVAGSFDPAYTVLVGTETTPGSGELQFKHANTLMKFTIGGDVAPETISLKSFASRMCVGTYYYNVTNGEMACTAGGHDVTLTAPDGGFKVGETYYISLVPGATKNLTLYFDGVAVKSKGAEVVKTFEAGKIYNMGTAEKPEVQLTATQVLAKQSSGATSFMTTFGGTANTNRNIGLDNNYVYIAETQGSPVLWKVALADGTASKLPVTTVNGAATHALACPRFIPNSDPSINDGKDVLVVCSMGMDGQDTFLYVYNNGIENDPAKLSLGTAWMSRRVGDKFTYMSGDNGVTTLFMKDYNSGALLTFNLTMKDGTVSCTQATSRTYLLANWTESGAGAFYVYPGTSSSVEGMYASTEKGSYVVRKDDVLTADNKATYVAQWDDLAKFQGCHGFNFFKVGGANFIAYTKFSDQTVYVIKGAADAAGVKAALEANDVVWSAKIAANDNGCNPGHSAGDCALSVIDDNNVYVAGNIQNVGVVVYRLSVE